MHAKSNLIIFFSNVYNCLLEHIFATMQDAQMPAVTVINSYCLSSILNQGLKHRIATNLKDIGWTMEVQEEVLSFL